MIVSLGHDQVLLINRDEAGRMPPAFENTHKYVIVFGPVVEIRQYERLGPAKYAIHTETVVAPAPVTEVAFVETFERAWKADPLDVRKAVRMAIKAV